MTPAALNLAVRLYSLALLAHMDAGGAETPDEMKVLDRATGTTRRRPERMGYDWMQVDSLQGHRGCAKCRPWPLNMHHRKGLRT